MSAVVTVLLAGCGLYVPQKDLLHANVIDENGRSRQGKVESNIIANIRCEVTKGLYEALATGNVPWLAGWGATISLNLTWDEQSNLAPGLTYSNPIGGTKVFSLGGGLSATAHATRLEAITFTLENKTLLQEALLTRRLRPGGLDCSSLEDGTTIHSDLKIDEFIYDKATIAGGHEATTNLIDHPQFSTFQETLTFVVSLGGSIHPSWKLTRFSVNPDGKFLGATRMKTSLIIITLGPLAKPATAAGPAELRVQARVQHDAALIGASTAAALVSQSR
jgi:hypothetical protein